MGAGMPSALAVARMRSVKSGRSEAYAVIGCSTREQLPAYPKAPEKSASWGSMIPSALPVCSDLRRCYFRLRQAQLAHGEVLFEQNGQHAQRKSGWIERDRQR